MQRTSTAYCERAGVRQRSCSATRPDDHVAAVSEVEVVVESLKTPGGRSAAADGAADKHHPLPAATVGEGWATVVWPPGTNSVFAFFENPDSFSQSTHSFNVCDQRLPADSLSDYTAPAEVFSRELTPHWSTLTSQKRGRPGVLTSETAFRL